MKKSFFKLMLTFVMVISFSAVASQAHAISENKVEKSNVTEPLNEPHGNMYQYDELFTNYGWPWTAISKTITKDYPPNSEVPASVYYTEYINDKWYSGILQRTGEVQKLSHAWRATYTGKINY